jgi:RNA polymerase sigma-70 factor, ECF subfamily
MWPKAVLEMDMVVEKAKEGDRSAFEKLYTLYKIPVHSLCLRLTRDVLDAEDLTQEVFLQVYRKVTSFRGEATFGSWLYRVTTNVALMHLRKRHLEKIPLDVLEPENASRVPASGAGRRHGCDPVERIALLRALCRLSKGRRTLIFLHDVTGFTHNEVAQILGVPVNTSKCLLYRAHRKLRETLGGTHMHTRRATPIFRGLRM